MPPKKDKGSLEKVNNKGRQAMSGTTSQARRQAREILQCTSLAMTDPPATSSASLQEKEEALKKALASAEGQKAEALAKEHEEEDTLKKVEQTLSGRMGPGAGL
jgi:siderophore synthetase component